MGDDVIAEKYIVLFFLSMRDQEMSQARHEIIVTCAIQSQREGGKPTIQILTNTVDFFK